ncbi:amidohydrolase family protein [Aurantibacter crassamenti]|uniref:amidohydrolase family protein n=1 Tax=Aurantibacter crassamenti TaxID=1837375 RepID=UPI00193A93BD|nr:amidohydrolase family protein [Aurantibacter crassamenti]MBM1105646.1 amidohydrolase family protein [Aurantibacter crassamenti]
MKLIGPFKQLLPMTGLPLKGALADNQLVILKDAGILIEGEIIVAIDSFIVLKQKYANAEIHELKGDHTCLPGFIDSQTQICFGGSGITKDFWEIVVATRNTSQEILSKKTAKLANRHLKNGTTTIEIKSGFGLSVAEELKMLRAIKDAATQTKVDIITTCFAAQRSPKDATKNKSTYLQEISSELFPVLKEEKLTERIAVTDTSGFNEDQIASHLEKARAMEFNIVTIENGLSKCNTTTLASTHEEVIFTALAGTSIGLGTNFTPARKILDNGDSLAIASNHNPLTAPMGDLLTQATILGAFEKLTNAEVLAAITVRAAAELNLKNSGQLATGKLADFILFHTNDYKDILYNQGAFKPCVVYKKGEVVFDKH